MSLSLTTISSMCLVSVWTEGLRTDLLDLPGLADACCSPVSAGLSSSPTPPPRSHSPSSPQSGHRRERSCSRFGMFCERNPLPRFTTNGHTLAFKRGI